VVVVRTAVPQPPYPVELIADLQADNLPPAVQTQLWPLVRRDPDAVRVLHALDRVSDELRTLGTDYGIARAIPSDVAERLDRALDLAPQTEESYTTVHRLPVPNLPIGSDSRTADAADLYRPHEVSRVAVAELTPSRRRWFVAAAAVGSVAAAAALVFATIAIRTPDADAPVVASPQHGAIDLGNEITPAILVGLLGHHEASGPLTDHSRASACLVANGLDPARSILGSANVTFRGQQAILLLVPGPHSPQITALIVAPDCGPSNPNALARTDIG